MKVEQINRASGAAIGFIFAVILFVALSVVVKFSVGVPAIDADSAAVRTKALAEMRAAETKSLDNPGWVDESRGVVRLPVETAMQMAGREWQNPAKARAEKAANTAPKTIKKVNPAE